MEYWTQEYQKADNILDKLSKMTPAELGLGSHADFEFWEHRRKLALESLADGFSTDAVILDLVLDRMNKARQAAIATGRPIITAVQQKSKSDIHTETQPEFRLLPKTSDSTPHILRKRRIFLPNEDQSEVDTSFRSTL